MSADPESLRPRGEARRSPLRLGIRIAVGATFTVAIVWLAAAHLTVEALDQTLMRVALAPALAVLSAYLAVALLRTLRFRVAGARAPLGTLFCIAAVHAALLRVMPLRSGELAYGVLLKRSGGGGFGEGLATIAMLRLLDLATVLPAAAALLALGPIGLAHHRAPLAILVAAAVLLAVFFALRPLSRALAARLGPGGGEQGLRGAVARAVTGLARAYDLPLWRRLALVVLTALLWAAVLVWFHLSLQAIGLALSPLEGASVGVLGVLGSVLPVSLIGSFGPMEGGFAVGLAGLGHPEAAATAESIVASGLTFLSNWAVALPAWVVLLLTGRGESR
jgi:uncharacterized membrane protein YbhN (UPF0104 family)